MSQKKEKPMVHYLSALSSDIIFSTVRVWFYTMRNCSESSEGCFCSSSYLCEGAHFQRNFQCVNYAQSNYYAGHWKFTPNWMLLKQTSQFTCNTEVRVKRKCIMDFRISVTHCKHAFIKKKLTQCFSSIYFLLL